MRQDLLNDINNFASSLAKVSIWHNSLDAFGHISESTPSGAKVIAKDDYFYEFYCYLKIINDLNSLTNNSIVFVKNNGVFPRGPAKKTNRPYFILEHNNKELYHIQSGTKIETEIKGKTKAPDISFQLPTADPDLPDYKDVHIIYDAKYSDGSKLKSFSESQMSDFNKMIRYLKTKKANKKVLPYNSYVDFIGNCLITNKKSYTIVLAELKKERITVVEDFDIGKKYNIIK